MTENKFILKADFSPTGDQPQAIEKLVSGIRSGMREQVLLGVTGSGKTFTMANVIAQLNRPTLILEPNKTLAAQICSEMRSLFPDNAVEYFVSYYDYYQPEAYVPGKDIYIEKDASINDEIDKLRHSATSALFERTDVIVVCSVSCIYTLGDPNEYRKQVISLRPGNIMSREDLIKRLVSLQYNRNDFGFDRNNFRVHGDIVEVFPSNSTNEAVRVEFFGDEIERVSLIDVITGEVKKRLSYAPVYPSSHYITDEEVRKKALKDIEDEMYERIEFFESQGKFIEAQRIKERTSFDVEQLRELGFCSGIENYSRVLAGRKPGSTPYTLLDFFPDDYLMFIDESHVAVGQVRGMSGGDNARKRNLIDYGFRLPSAYDNRPLKFDEFLQKKGVTVYVSATPGDFEKERAEQTAEQIIRPTGLLDPEVEVRPTKGQIDDLLGEINERVKKNERVLITTLTKRMAEDLSEYLERHDVKCRYLHYDIDTIERMELLRDLRLGEFDVLVGINLLREGLDLPEVSLVAILDADKEGFLRSDNSLIQTIGRAARNENGKVIMYADKITGAMSYAINETNRRRRIQDEYNKAHGIVPKTVVKAIADKLDLAIKDGADKQSLTKQEKKELIEKLTKQMKKSAEALDFETAAAIRDRIKELRLS